MSRLRRFVGRLVIALAVAGGSTLFLAWFWRLIGGGALSVHGWIAMGLGIGGTVGLAWLLMSLAFRSDRDGWDARVDNSLDPGREGQD